MELIPSHSVIFALVSLYSFSSYAQRDGGASDGPQGCCGAPGI